MGLDPEDTMAANFARKATDPNSELNKLVAGKMCWDAVLTCAEQAGIIKPGRIAGAAMADPSDPPVAGKAGMLKVPEGHILTFYGYHTTFRDVRPIHSMISLGRGRAAGIKNDCIGIGSAYSWEALDLATGLPWNSDGTFNAPLTANQTRKITIRHRPISTLRYFLGRVSH